ncbi:MAG: ATP-binding protein, partial [Candidatus Thermoplasmatota archaeon]|nr:ATP-binding protein [Candidatus Thermoplasmatota archaeon]
FLTLIGICAIWVNVYGLILYKGFFFLMEKLPEIYGLIGRVSVRKKKDGSLVQVSASAAPIKVDGHLIGSVVMYKDITQRKQAEGELKAHREQLKLVNKIMRHDILNDLTIVRGALSVYKETNDEKYLEKAFEHIKKSAELIRKMREHEFSIPTSKDLKLYDARKVIEGVTKNYTTTELNIEGDCKVFADDTFYSVIDNIVSNAVTHGKTDKIDITMNSKDDFCEIRIADYGVGIPDEIKEKVFDDHFSYGETGGTGLGLYIVKKTVERYGGSVYIEDNKPNGSIFVIKLKGRERKGSEIKPALLPSADLPEKRKNF